ncbi:hypothetical protein [Yokenella regensburgei]|uniref:hypothetical protein n=1 Tax=Yokenella regensburgei TaxID=158877 RepID=UPI0011DE1AC6|nr:hypothetical protein [Yokenella regensburgei]
MTGDVVLDLSFALEVPFKRQMHAAGCSGLRHADYGLLIIDNQITHCLQHATDLAITENSPRFSQQVA